MSPTRKIYNLPIFFIAALSLFVRVSESDQMNLSFVILGVGAVILLGIVSVMAYNAPSPNDIKLNMELRRSQLERDLSTPVLLPTIPHNGWEETQTNARDPIGASLLQAMQHDEEIRA